MHVVRTLFLRQPLCLFFSFTLLAYLRPLTQNMATSTIQIDVELDEKKVPQNIEWKATDSTMERPLNAKAFILSIWDGADKAALRIDLWTQKMMVDEMADFYFQTMMTMADTFERATKMSELTAQMKTNAQQFYRSFQEMQMKTHKAG